MRKMKFVIEYRYDEEINNKNLQDEEHYQWHHIDISDKINEGKVNILKFENLIEFLKQDNASFVEKNIKFKNENYWKTIGTNFEKKFTNEEDCFVDDKIILLLERQEKETQRQRQQESEKVQKLSQKIDQICIVLDKIEKSQNDSMNIILNMQQSMQQFFQSSLNNQSNLIYKNQRDNLPIINFQQISDEIDLSNNKSETREENICSNEQNICSNEQNINKNQSVFVMDIDQDKDLTFQQNPKLFLNYIQQEETLNKTSSASSDSTIKTIPQINSKQNNNSSILNQNIIQRSNDSLKEDIISSNLQIPIQLSNSLHDQKQSINSFSTNISNNLNLKSPESQNEENKNTQQQPLDLFNIKQESNSSQVDFFEGINNDSNNNSNSNRKQSSFQPDYKASEILIDDPSSQNNPINQNRTLNQDNSDQQKDDVNLPLNYACKQQNQQNDSENQNLTSKQGYGNNETQNNNEKNQQDSNFNNYTDMTILYSEPLMKMTKYGLSPDKDPVDFEFEIQKLTDFLKESNKQIKLDILVATLDNLDKVFNGKSQILHIMCHGDYLPEEKQYALDFENQETVLDAITSSRFQDLLKQRQHNIKLVFLNACHSEPLGKIFQEAGIPFVIAVQQDLKIEDKAAITFSSSFYMNIFSGYSVQKSFDLAKNSLQAKHHDNCFTCCCAHSHDNKCKWFEESKNKKINACEIHQYQGKCYCKNAKKMLHSSKCAFANNFLSKYKDDLENYSQIIPEQDQEIFICCCKTISTPHDESLKFRLIKNPNQENCKIMTHLLEGKIIKKCKFDSNHPVFQDQSKIFGRYDKFISRINLIK